MYTLASLVAKIKESTADFLIVGNRASEFHMCVAKRQYSLYYDRN